MSTFLVTLVAGPAWDHACGRREQDGWDAHAAFMDLLVLDGAVVLGGPVGTGERVALAFEADDDGEVRSLLDADPWVLDGLLELGSVEPWAFWLDGRS